MIPSAFSPRSTRSTDAWTRSLLIFSLLIEELLGEKRRLLLLLKMLLLLKNGLVGVFVVDGGEQRNWKLAMEPHAILLAFAVDSSWREIKDTNQWSHDCKSIRDFPVASMKDGSEWLEHSWQKWSTWEVGGDWISEDKDSLSLSQPLWFFFVPIPIMHIDSNVEWSPGLECVCVSTTMIFLRSNSNNAYRLECRMESGFGVCVCG